MFPSGNPKVMAPVDGGLDCWPMLTFGRLAVHSGLWQAVRTADLWGRALGFGGRGFLLTLGSEVLEALAGRFKEGFQPAHRTKTAQNHVAIQCIKLDSETASAGSFGRNEAGTGAAKWIQHDAFAARAVPDRILN
jgi:hypothetical protein